MRAYGGGGQVNGVGVWLVGRQACGHRSGKALRGLQERLLLLCVPTLLPAVSSSSSSRQLTHVCVPAEPAEAQGQRHAQPQHQAAGGVLHQAVRLHQCRRYGGHASQLMHAEH